MGEIRTEPVRGGDASGADAGGGPAQRVRRIETPEAFREAFERELVHGAMFLPRGEILEEGTRLPVTLELTFCDLRLALEGEVVGSLPPGVTRAGATPGTSLRLLETPLALHRRLEAATGLALPSPDPTPPGLVPRAPRFEARAQVEIEADDQRFTGESANLSTQGILILLPDAKLAPRTALRLRIHHPGSGETLQVGGRVATPLRCHDGVTALGVQFLYPLERFEEVERFVDALRSFHHARALATVSGSLADAPLHVVVETFASACRAGTLRIRCGEQEGRLAYRDGELLYATAGLVTGSEALARMLGWNDGRFEFRSEVEPIAVGADPVPLDSALIAAAVERDEVARLDGCGIGPETTFQVDAQRLADLEPSLDALARELCENASMGFPLGALLDLLAASDSLVYKALFELVDAGVLRPE